MFGQIRLSCEIRISYDYVELWSHLTDLEIGLESPSIGVVLKGQVLLFVFLFKLLLLCV